MPRPGFANTLELRPPRPETGFPAPPWPSEPVPKLLWIAQNGVRPWLPTPAQQDQAWSDWAEQNRRLVGQKLAG